jgi:hypothetical protein
VALFAAACLPANPRFPVLDGWAEPPGLRLGPR